jgi:hypothetical protein
VIGSSAGGIEACEIVELLAADDFDGQVLVLGSRVSPMVAAVRELGKGLGLSMLPLLATPFGREDVSDCIAALVPSALTPIYPPECGRGASSSHPRAFVSAEDRYPHAHVERRRSAHAAASLAVSTCLAAPMSAKTFTRTVLGRRAPWPLV